MADEALRRHIEAPATPPEASLHPSRLPVVAAATAAIAGLLLLVLGQGLAGLALLGAAAFAGVWTMARHDRGAMPNAQPNAGSASGVEEPQNTVQRAEEDLRAALAARGAATEGDIRAATQAYEVACAERDDLARGAAGAEGLRRAIEARAAAEEGAARAVQSVVAAEVALRQAASRIAVAVDGDPDSLAADLAAWQGRRAEVARSSEIAIREWQELQGLLAGRTLPQLQAEAADRATAAGVLEGRAGELGRPVGRTGNASRLDEARSEASRAKAVLDELSGELRLMASTLPDVAEAEERVDAAGTELARVQDLAGVIDETLSLLEAAERRVHRDLAPILTEAVQRHLPAITGGAYIEVGMNPRDLSVDVKEARTGQWRDARLLSEGTREQIYLLLRVAMAEHLVTTDERAPLLLDEVTAQSDPERKRRMLDVLHALSADRQVILFSHDAEVVEWAGQALTEPRDRLVRVTAPSNSSLAEAASR